jgi:hypothetical protein
MLALHGLLFSINALTMTLHLPLTRQVSCTDNRAITMWLLHRAIFTSFHFIGSSRRGGYMCYRQHTLTLMQHTSKRKIWYIDNTEQWAFLRPTLAQIIKKFRSFHGSWRFGTASTSIRQIRGSKQHFTTYHPLSVTCFYPPFNLCPPTIVYSIYWQLPSTSAVRLPHPIKHSIISTSL